MIKLYPIYSINELLIVFPNRKINAIYHKANVLNLQTKKTWSKEAIDKLKQLFPLMSIKELQKYFPNRSLIALYHKTDKLGLKKKRSKGDKYK